MFFEAHESLNPTHSRDKMSWNVAAIPQLNRSAMKIRFLISALILLSAASGCKKDDESRQFQNWLPGPMTFGKITAMRDSDVWKASCYAAESKAGDGFFYFIAGTWDEDGAAKEEIGIEPIPLKTGQFPVKYKPVALSLDGRCLATFALLDDDLILATYLPDSSFVNYVEVTEYDSLTRVVKGIFDIHFTAANEAYKPWPKTVHFSNGAFEATLQD